MPTFCRHNRFLANCPICRQPEPERGARPPGGRSSASGRRGSSSASARPRGGGMRVRRMTQAPDDGYRHELVSGLKASADARRLAEELAFAAARLAELAADPPGLYATVAAQDDGEEARWLAFEIAFLGPLGGHAGDDPFANVRAAHVPWATGELPDFAAASFGPRGTVEPARAAATVEGYRVWAGRAGSQHAALFGEASWTPERRFDRIFERLALPGFGRGSRCELLVTLSRLGLLDARATSLHVGGEDAVTVAAKRVFAIGDTVLLERRARELADAIDLPIEALDLGLFNWLRHPQPRATQGSAAEPAAEHAELLAAALGA